MKKIVFGLMALGVFQVHAYGFESKTLICSDQTTKIALKTSSPVFYEADTSVPDVKVARSAHANPEGVVSYDAQLNQFDVNNEMGCVPLKYETKTDSNGIIQAIVTNEDDKSQSIMDCHWL